MGNAAYLGDPHLVRSYHTDHFLGMRAFSYEMAIITVFDIYSWCCSFPHCMELIVWAQWSANAATRLAQIGR